MRTLLVGLALIAACSSSRTSREHQPSQTAAPIALAVVFEGTWGLLGDELTLSDQNLLWGDGPLVEGVYPGAYVPLRVALDAAFAELPAGSETTLIAYARRANVLAHGPSATVTSAAIGGQRAYTGGAMAELVGGIDAGLAALATSDQATKVLIVIGDGTHYDTTRAAELLAARGLVARMRGITMAAFVIKASYSREADIGAAMPVIGTFAHWELVSALRTYVRALRQV